MKNGFRTSPLALNANLGIVNVWDEAAIDHRTEELAKTALLIWATPEITSERLELYRVVKKPKSSPYTILDHPKLAEGTKSRILYDALKSEVLALDSCVYEEFLKLYVAFKAETNFADVVPNVDYLRLSLNMPFHQLNDPRNMATDITDAGRWGNGDVSINLRAPEEIPYVVGLIRQSLERQLAAAGGE